MTISSTTRKAGPFTGDGVTTAFPFTFKVFSTSDVRVVRAVAATLAETDLVETTDYTVTLNGNQDTSPGGTVTLLVALAATYKLTVTSKVPELQSTVTTNQGGFFPAVFNSVFDRLTILVQQNIEKMNRSIRFPISAGLSASEVLPIASGYLRWKADATGVETVSQSQVAADLGLAVGPATYAAAVAAAATYADANKLSKAANLSDVASAGTARTNLGLGTAATKDVGVAPNNVVQLDGSSKLPAVDGSALTGLAGFALPVTAKTASFTHTSAQNSTVYEFSGSLGTGVVLTISPATLGASKLVGADNLGTAPFLITPSSGTIDGLASIYVYPGERFLIRSDGTNLRTIGRQKRVLVTQTTISGTPTSVDFEAFSGDTEAVRLTLNLQRVSVTGGNTPVLRFKKSGSYATTSYGYTVATVNDAPTTAVNTSVSSGIYIPLNYGSGVTGPFNTSITFYDIGASGKAACSWRLEGVPTGGTDMHLGGYGRHTVAGAVQGVRLSTVTGTDTFVTGGIVSLWLERE